jgi:N-acetylglutamate synthase-like GNAT family acetyltransferase
MNIIETAFDEFFITTDRAKMDVAAVHDFLTHHAYWCKGIPFQTVQNAIDHSLNFGLFHRQKQIGFARIISDYTTVAYLADVYILDAYRGKGLSKKLMDSIMSHPQLQGLRRWILLTSSADWLYEKFGFKKIARPEIYMELHQPDVYKKTTM